MGTRNWDDLAAEMAAQDPDHEANMADARDELKAEEEAYFRGLADVRKARDLTQEELAEALGIKQTSVSKVERAHERHADLYLSTLRRFIQAMGGELRLTAVFDDVEVPFDNFREVDASNPEAHKLPGRPQPDHSAPLEQAM